MKYTKSMNKQAKIPKDENKEKEADIEQYVR